MVVSNAFDNNSMLIRQRKNKNSGKRELMHRFVDEMMDQADEMEYEVCIKINTFNLFKFKH